MKKLFKCMYMFIAVIFLIIAAPTSKSYAANREVEPNNTASSANTIEINTVYTGNLESKNDVDYYKVVVASDGEVTLNFNHEDIPGDSTRYWYVRLADSNNNIYMEEGVCGNEPNITLKRGLPNGTYYVSVTYGYSGHYSSMDYDISISLKSSNYYEKEFNDKMASANLISLGKEYTGKLSSRDDKDYYKVIVPSDGEVTLNFNHEDIPGDSTRYWYVRLADSNNNIYMEEGVCGNEPNITLKRGLPNGTYYVSVTYGYSGHYSSMDYDISVSLKSSNYYEKEFNDKMASANSISLGKKYTGKISNSDDKDYYKFTLPTDEEVLINFSHKGNSGTEICWKIKLLDSKNNIYAEKDIQSSENNTSFKTKLSKGTYYIYIYRGYRYYNTSDYNISANVNVSSVKLNKTSLSLVNGKTETLKATVGSSNATNKAITWTTSNKKVVTVDSNGKVKAVGVGTATITCKAKDGSGKSVTCKVTVKPINVRSIKLNKTSLSLVNGKTETLKATINPTNATNKTVTWTSSNKKVATVDSNGKVKAVGVGTATITCKAKDGSGKSVICKVTVKKAVNVTSIKLNKTSLSLVNGKTETLKATINPTNATNKAVTWTSSNKKVATVDSNGKVKAVGVGTATITCKAKDGSGKTVTCKVTVKKI